MHYTHSFSLPMWSFSGTRSVRACSADTTMRWFAFGIWIIFTQGLRDIASNTSPSMLSVTVDAGRHTYSRAGALLSGWRRTGQMIVSGLVSMRLCAGQAGVSAHPHRTSTQQRNERTRCVHSGRATASALMGVSSKCELCDHCRRSKKSRDGLISFNTCWSPWIVSVLTRLRPMKRWVIPGRPAGS